jgi:hypothetical protein
MIRTVNNSIIIIDTSAVIAIANKTDQYHNVAQIYFDNSVGNTWAVMNATTHETFTRARYNNANHLDCALKCYDDLRGGNYKVFEFNQEDEKQARSILGRYCDQIISFHDALCVALMKRIGIFRIFTFDKHFRTLGYQLGFQVEPILYVDTLNTV